MLRDIWIIMLVLAFLCFLLGLLLSFIWKVPNLMDELSGRKAKRQIKILQDLNTNTETFDRLTTTEIYSSIPSGTLLNEELVNIDERSFIKGNTSEDEPYIENEYEEKTSILEVDDKTSLLEDEDGTSILEEDEEGTSLLGNSYKLENKVSELNISIIEEQSSL